VRYRPGSTRKQDNLCSFGKISGRSGQAEHRPEKRVTWPRTSSTALPMMPGQGCPRLPVGSARTWLQQRYYSERCRNHPPPRGSVSRESSRISWKMPRTDGPRALPPEGRGTPRSITPRPSSPPRREGAPRRPPQAWGTLRQWGGSEPLARTTRSASFQPGHTTGAVPDPVPNPDYHHQVLGGVKARTVARGLPADLPAGWDGR
jgi:hypothetical protein